MPNVIALLRSNTAGSRPTAKQAGEPYYNGADKQFGVFDGAANDLIAVRFFSATATYAVGDHVVEAGAMYRCITAVATPGAFAPANWESVGAGAVDLTPYLLLAGGQMTGPLLLAAPPTDPLGAATKAYIDSIDADLDDIKAERAGDTFTGPVILAADPLQPLEAATMQFVTAGDTALQSQIDLLASNLLFSGSIDVVTDTGAYTPESGIPAGPLPAAGVANTNMYVIVSSGGTAAAGNIPAGDYALGDWIVSDGTSWVQMPIGQAVMTGDSVAITPPATQPGWTNIQLAIDGLEAGKLALAGGTMTGVLTLAADPVGLLEPVTLGALNNAILDAGTY